MNLCSKNEAFRLKSADFCIQKQLENHYFITCVRCGIRSRAACVDLVYRSGIAFKMMNSVLKMINSAFK